MWKAVERHVEPTIPRHKSNLKRRLNRTRCDEKDNVFAHLQEMEYIYQELASWNARIPEEDYADAIIRSLPQSYSDLMTSLLRTCSQMEVQITPEVIKDTIYREYWTRQMATPPRNGRPSKVTIHADVRAKQPGRRRGRRGSRGGDYRGGD